MTPQYAVPTASTITINGSATMDLYANAVAVADGYRPTVTHNGRIIWEGTVVDDQVEANTVAQAQLSKARAKLLASVK